MGGFLSGPRSGLAAKIVESVFTSLDVRELHRKGDLRPGAELDPWLWLLDPDRRLVRGHATEDALHLEYRFRVYGERWEDVETLLWLEWTPCRYGGRRPWFLCPGTDQESCERRCAVVYGLRFIPELLCRQCCDLRYRSQRETDDLRALHRAQKIRQRLGGILQHWSHPFPPKPPRMRWETYWRLREEALPQEQAALENINRRIGALSRDIGRKVRAFERQSQQFRQGR